MSAPTFDDLLARIDRAIADHTGASLASATVVADDLLDVRLLVTAIQREMSRN